MDKNKRTFVEVLIAQWPGFLGFGFVAAGLMIIWDAKMHAPHRLNIRLVAVLMAFGIASLGYWAMANRSDDYNF